MGDTAEEELIELIEELGGARDYPKKKRKKRKKEKS